MEEDVSESKDKQIKDLRIMVSRKKFGTFKSRCKPVNIWGYSMKGNLANYSTHIYALL